MIMLISMRTIMIQVKWNWTYKDTHKRRERNVKKTHSKRKKEETKQRERWEREKKGERETHTENTKEKGKERERHTHTENTKEKRKERERDTHRKYERSNTISETPFPFQHTKFSTFSTTFQQQLFSSFSIAGITLIMKTEVGDYPGSGLAESTGFLVQVHYRYENPNAFHSGFLVSPGTETRVVLTVVSGLLGVLSERLFFSFFFYFFISIMFFCVFLYCCIYTDAHIYTNKYTYMQKQVHIQTGGLQLVILNVFSTQFVRNFKCIHQIR